MTNTINNLEYKNPKIFADINAAYKYNLGKGLAKVGIDGVLNQEVLDAKKRGELDQDIIERYAGRNLLQEMSNLKMPDNLSNEGKRTIISAFLNCRPDQISFTKSEAVEGRQDIIYHHGDLDLYMESINYLTLPMVVSGNLDLSRLTKIEILNFPISIRGNLDLQNLESAKNLVLPQSVWGYLNLSSLISAKDITLSETVGWSISLDSLNSIENLDLSNIKYVETIYLSRDIYDDYKDDLEEAYPNLAGKFKMR